VPLLASLATTGLSALAAGLIAMTVPWALLSAGHSASLAGAAAFALQIPVALGLLLGGPLVDRMGPRRVLILSNGAALALVAAAAALTLWGPAAGAGVGVGAVPAALIPVVALLALANLSGQPGTLAQDARVPELARLAGVPLERANGLREIAMNMGLVGGPALGVLLVERLGLPGALTLAAGMLAAIALVDGIFFPAFRAKAAAADDERTRTRILRHPLLGAVAVIGVMLVAVFAAMDEIVAPSLVLAADLSGDALALFLALAGAAAMTASALFAAFGDRIGHRALFIGGIAVMAAGMVLLALLPPALALVVAPVPIGLGVGHLWPLIVTAIHRQVPTSDRGRVIGTLSAVILLAQPFAALGAGPAVDVLGPAAMTSLIAGLVVLALVASLLAPGLRQLGRAP
jgi:MFS family permease